MCWALTSKAEGFFRVKVQQTPADIYSKPGKSAKINCSHDESRFDQIHWYKQLRNRQLQYLGYMNFQQPKPEDGVNVNIDGGASKGENCTLTVTELDVNSSGLTINYNSWDMYIIVIQLLNLE
uniref:Immunoglobulin V-set domain-containing protein n=1 Tax=Echeneis naucrates TaxID=173247 RepID=A0A665W5F8_ECHNA